MRYLCPPENLLRGHWGVLCRPENLSPLFNASPEAYHPGTYRPWSRAFLTAPQGVDYTDRASARLCSLLTSAILFLPDGKTATPPGRFTLIEPGCTKRANLNHRPPFNSCVGLCYYPAR
jgi:hypothetical protein